MHCWVMIGACLLLANSAIATDGRRDLIEFVESAVRSAVSRLNRARRYTAGHAVVAFIHSLNQLRCCDGPMYRPKSALTDLDDQSVARWQLVSLGGHGIVAVGLGRRSKLSCLMHWNIELAAMHRSPSHDVVQTARHPSHPAVTLCLASAAMPIVFIAMLEMLPGRTSYTLTFLW